MIKTKRSFCLKKIFRFFYALLLTVTKIVYQTVAIFSYFINFKILNRTPFYLPLF